MNDLDIIVDESQVKPMKDVLMEQGFIQTTFINKRMPFYKNLLKQSKSIYLRFSKDGVNIEILSTRFIKIDSSLKFDLYPNFWVKIPISSLTKTKLGKTEFTTLDVNLLWAIKYLLHNSLGKFMHHKREQRAEDLSHLRKLVNLDKAKRLISQSRFGFKSFAFKVPVFFFK